MVCRVVLLLTPDTEGLSVSDNQEFNHPENPYAAPSVSPDVLNPQISPDNTRRKELRAFVGPGASYYLQKWAPILENVGKDAGFNLAALLLPPFWLAYRKMYAQLFILTAIFSVEIILEHLVFVYMLGMTEVSGIINMIFCFIIAVICGVHANRWYLSRAEIVIAETHYQGFDGKDLLYQLSNRGGTSLLLSLGLNLLCLLITCINVMLYILLMDGSL